MNSLLLNPSTEENAEHLKSISDVLDPLSCRMSLEISPMQSSFQICQPHYLLRCDTRWQTLCTITAPSNTLVWLHVLKDKIYTYYTSIDFLPKFWIYLDSLKLEKIEVFVGADPGFKRAPAFEAKSCWYSGVELYEWSELSVVEVQDPLNGPGSFWVFNSQICILPYSRDSFSLIFDI